MKIICIVLLIFLSVVMVTIEWYLKDKEIEEPNTIHFLKPINDNKKDI